MTYLYLLRFNRASNAAWGKKKSRAEAAADKANEQGALGPSKKKNVTNPSGIKRNAVASDKQGKHRCACAAHRCYIQPSLQNMQKNVFGQTGPP